MQNNVAPLLLEVGTEELPPGNLSSISQDFSDIIVKSLADLGFVVSNFQAFSTPRRLAVFIDSISNKQPDRTVLRKGPAVKAAYDEAGNPSKAALGFAKSCGVSFENIEKVETDKGAWLSFSQDVKGQTLEVLLGEIVEGALNKLKFTKRMRWGDHDFAFSRPIHWVCALHGKNPVNINVFNLKSVAHSFGHRVHAPGPCALKDAKDYENSLKNAYVMVSPMNRKAIIESESSNIAEKINGNVVFDADLLETVTHLVEWPVPLLGSFSEDFLKVPQEALISSMQNHQKCFPIYNQSKQLAPHFIMISNLDTPPFTEIISGNERVMQARLQDATFFYNQDQKAPLSSRIDDLKKVVFQHKLGSMYDKSQRVAKLAKHIAKQIGANPALAEQAAMIAKADLLTHMVYEFPELQGIMGRYYAQLEKLPEEVAVSIEQAYWPKFAKDNLPEVDIALCLSLSDRLDTLAGIFGIGMIPTGDKDPFALRRAAIAILRIIIEKNLHLDLKALLQLAIDGYGKLIDNSILPKLLAFCLERINALYSEKGLDLKVLEAVLAKDLTHPHDIHARIMAVNTFKTMPEAQSLAQANKRVQNILNKSGIVLNLHEIAPIDNKLLEQDAEKDLAEKLTRMEDQITPLLAAGDYEKSLKLLANLQNPVDKFFDEVMVMVDDHAIKQNRINLVSHLCAIFLKIADISRLAL